jgi:hypothetical protein
MITVTVDTVTATATTVTGGTVSRSSMGTTVS